MEGDYNVSVAIPEGYNPTTSLNAPITLVAGDITYLNFGAQAGSVVIDENANCLKRPAAPRCWGSWASCCCWVGSVWGCIRFGSGGSKGKNH